MATKSCPECDQQVRKCFDLLFDNIAADRLDLISPYFYLFINFYLYHSQSRRKRDWSDWPVCTRVNTPNPGQKPQQVSCCWPKWHYCVSDHLLAHFIHIDVRPTTPYYCVQYGIAQYCLVKTGLKEWSVLFLGNREWLLKFQKKKVETKTEFRISVYFVAVFKGTIEIKWFFFFFSGSKLWNLHIPVRGFARSNRHGALVYWARAFHRTLRINGSNIPPPGHNVELR